MDDGETSLSNKTSSNVDVDREEFYRTLTEVYFNKKASNSALLSREKYNWTLEKVKSAKREGKKTPADYRRAKKYEVLDTPDGERLFSANVRSDGMRQMFVPMDEMYDIITACHLKLNHGGRSRMMIELKRKYRNVTTESVIVYLSMCYSCKNKVVIKHRTRGRFESKTKESNEMKDINFASCNSTTETIENSNLKLDMESEELFNDLRNTTYKYPELYSRGQVDILGVTNETTEDYKYLMVYRNFVTKFIHLKAMKELCVEDAVDGLLDIFLVFGAPNILQSKNGMDLVKPICRKISNLVPDIKVLASDEIFSKEDFNGKANEDILKKLNAWLAKSKNTKWQDGIKYVQHELNTTFHEILCRTPSELVFGDIPKKGIASFMPKGAYEDLISEQDLIAVIDSRDNYDPIVPKQLKFNETLMLPCNFIKKEIDTDTGLDDEMEDD